MTVRQDSGLTQIASVTSQAGTTSYTYESFSRVAAVDAAQERLWNDYRSLLFQNNQLITDESTVNDGDKKAEKFKDILDSLVNGANDFLEQLSFIGVMHPVAGVAIFAFQKVIQLDIARRDNDKKILILALEMQGMMSPIFQLRFINRENIPKEAGDVHQENLKQLMTEIAQNINKCRNDIAEYMKRKLMVKLCLAHRFEKKFEEHMKIFSSGRTQLQTVVSSYIAVGTSAANDSLARVEKKIDVFMDSQFDIIANIFRRLDTPTERRVFKYLRENGGAETCANSTRLLSELMQEAGLPPRDIADLREELIGALKENLNEILENNYIRFETMVRVENNNFQDNFMRLSAHLHDDSASKLDKVLDNTMIMMLQLGKVKSVSDRVEDPEFQQVWTRMQVAGNTVKATKFVLTLRDNIHFEESSPTIDILEFSETAFKTEATESDRWVLKYMDVTYLRPIIEAMDEDTSGFISVQEANRFSLARPKGLSLLNWIAYWAAGWHLNLHKFKKEIYSILLEMHATLPKIHVANRAYVDDYLDNQSLRRVEALLQFMEPLPEYGPLESKLLVIAEAVAKTQSKFLETNLCEAKYLIKSVEDVMTIAGSESARVEAWILPFLRLLLGHHLQIIQLAKTFVLDEYEFVDHITSLNFVLAAFDERLKNLKAKFLSLYQDIDAQFQTFSYRMFYAAFRKTDLDKTNTMYSLMNEYHGDAGTVFETDKSLDPKSILSRDIDTAFEYEDLDLSASESAPADHIPHLLEGLWYGWTSGCEIATQYFSRYVIHPILGKTFQGKGMAYFGSFQVTGELDTSTSSDGSISVKMKFLEQGESYRGTYDPLRQAIEGTFVLNPEDVIEDGESSKLHVVLGRETIPASNEDENSVGLEKSAGTAGSVKPVMGRFRFTRNPPAVLPSRDQFLVDASFHPPDGWNHSEIARKRWIFAIESVRIINRSTSGQNFKKILALRRKWLWFAIRSFLVEDGPRGSSRYDPLSAEEEDEYDTIYCGCNPRTALLYAAIAGYMTDRRIYDVGPISCDNCGTQIICIRHQCIICVLENSVNQIDLCVKCCDVPEFHSQSGFTHLSSHTLLRSRSRINAYQDRTLIAEARRVSEECKKIFRALEERKKEANKGQHLRKGTNIRRLQNFMLVDDDTRNSIPEGTDPRCYYCKDEVSTPCWVCLICSPYRFSCDACDKTSDHSRVHLSLRIHNSVEVKAKITNDIELALDGIKSTLENRLNHMLTSVNDIAKTVGVETLGSDGVNGFAAYPPNSVRDNIQNEAIKDETKHEVDDENLTEETEDKTNGEAVIDLALNLKPTPDEGQNDEEMTTRKEEIVKSQTNISVRLTALEEKFENMERKMDRQYESLMALLLKMSPTSVA